jgi:purine nucleosidase
MNAAAAMAALPGSHLRGQEVMGQRIIIDTDPGIDDAVAILLAFASAELEVLGLVAVAGNRPLSVTERNARALCELAEREAVPVYAGCGRPLNGPPYDAARAHGESGIGRLVLPQPRKALEEQHGVDFLIEAVRDAPDRSVALCALGPLTNIATALQRAPDIAGRIGEIVLMGGCSLPLGSMTPVAEFNIYCDPEAAAIIFASGVAITMVPLDVTQHLRTTPARRAAIAAIGSRCGDAVAELLRPVKPGRSAMRLHDPCVIAHLLAPELFKGPLVNVEIETGGRLTRGMTVIDWRRVSGRSANARVLNRVNAPGFYTLLTERLRALP